MKDYKPPFTITNEILTYVSSISEKVGRITATSNMEAKPHLRRNNRIKSIHSSLRIEANSLSLGQVRDVINGRVQDKKVIIELQNLFYVQYVSLDSLRSGKVQYYNKHIMDYNQAHNYNPALTISNQEQNYSEEFVQLMCELDDLCEEFRYLGSYTEVI